MKTALFFGSFNPIHFGHIGIANYVIDFTEVDDLWFVVSPQNPLKDKEILAPDFHRLEMVKRAFNDNEDRFKVCDIEMSMPKPSYTIDTLKLLSNNNPEREFIVIIGADSLETFSQWKDYKSITSDYMIFVYPRKGSDVSELANKYSARIVNAPLVDYSSTTVRERIAKCEDVRNLIPEDVYLYIKKMGLYKTK